MNNSIARFGDLADVVYSSDSDDELDTFLTRRVFEAALQVKVASKELQEVVDTFCLKELHALEFALTIVDPKQAGHPVVACSSGFCDLTGYAPQEIIGRSFEFLADGAPPCSTCDVASKGVDYDAVNETLSHLGLPKDETVCVQTSCMKSGKLIQAMHYTKKIELDEQLYILTLLELVDEENTEEDLQMKCWESWDRLSINMDDAEQILSTHFWYTGSMRRRGSLQWPSSERFRLP